MFLFNMVAIAPFRALRYNLDTVGDLSRVVAPPYDVISPEEQDQLYRLSPYNVIRLILGKESPADTPADNRYTRAKQTFEEWRAKGILVQDEAPAVYLCEHTFAWQGASYRRLGFVALLEFNGSVPDLPARAEHREAGKVLAHESTFEAPKADRTHLLEAVRANLSPIFCIAPDPDRLASTLEQVTRSQATLATAHMKEETVRVWALTDPHLIRQMQEQLAPVSVLIADGHHRFAVALSKRELCGAVMSYFAWLENPSVLMHAIHRVVRLAPVPVETWQARLSVLCQLEPASSLGQLAEWLASSREPGQFGYYARGQWFRATLRGEALANWLLHPSVPFALAGLDVSLLHRVMLPQLVGTDTVPAISYTPDAAKAAGVADAGEPSCAFVLRPIPLDQVFALANQGFTLPQKSTYFYPKVPSGLTINPFEPIASPRAIQPTRH